MKKITIILFILTLCLNCISCSNPSINYSEDTSSINDNVSTEAVNTEVNLTKENITDYVIFDGTFINGKYESSLFGYTSKATLEFQSYPAKNGEFKDVEITLIVTSDDFAFNYATGEEWHLADAPDDEKDHIKITFKIGIDGQFEKKYNVLCLYNSAILDGDAKFRVVSAKGTFLPK